MKPKMIFSLLFLATGSLSANGQTTKGGPPLSERPDMSLIDDIGNKEIAPVPVEIIVDHGTVVDAAFEGASKSSDSDIALTIDSPKLVDGSRIELRIDEPYVIQTRHNIRSVAGFDESILKVAPVNSRTLQLNAISTGATNLTLTNAKDQTIRASVFVRANDHGLKIILDELYPSFKIETWPISDSGVILRGQLPDALTASRVVAVAEQLFPSVLNQLTLDSNISPAAAQPQRMHPVGTTLEIQSGGPLSYLMAVGSHTLEFSSPILTLECSSRNLSLTPNAADKSTLRIFGEPGISRVRVVLKNGEKHQLQFFFQRSIQYLTELVRRLYPAEIVEFVPVDDAVIVIGSVSSTKHIDEIIRIAEQDWPVVLNHLDVVDSSKRSTIEKRLDEEVSLRFRATPLSEVIRGITAAYGINIVLADESLLPDPKVTLEVDGIKLKSALSLLLQQVGGLVYYIEDDLVLITNRLKQRSSQLPRSDSRVQHESKISTPDVRAIRSEIKALRSEVSELIKVLKSADN